MGVHAEGSDKILKFLGPVNNLALIEFICQMTEHLGGKFHPHADIHPVAFGGNSHIPAYAFHPFAAAASDRNNAVGRRIAFSVFCCHAVVFTFARYGSNRCFKEKVHFPLQIPVQVIKHNIVDIRPQMTYLCIQQMKSVLQAGFAD